MLGRSKLNTTVCPNVCEAAAEWPRTATACYLTANFSCSVKIRYPFGVR